MKDLVAIGSQAPEGNRHWQACQGLSKKAREESWLELLELLRMMMMQAMAKAAFRGKLFYIVCR